MVMIFLLSYTLDAILLRPDLHKFWKGHLFLYAILTYFTPVDSTINVYMYVYLFAVMQSCYVSCASR